jgi:phosphopantetheinyl transferase
MYIKRSINPSASLAILKMEAGKDYTLLINNKESIADILDGNHKSQIRKQQLIGARYLLQELIGDSAPYIIEYSIHGKPYIKGYDLEISISHTKEYIALILSKDKKVGIDIEILDPRIIRIENKFLRDDERAFIHPNHYLEQFYIIWSAKETLFKIYEKGGLIFKENLIVHPFGYSEKGTIQAEIFTPNHQKTYTLNYGRIDDLMMVYGIDGQF